MSRYHTLVERNSTTVQSRVLGVKITATSLDDIRDSFKVYITRGSTGNKPKLVGLVTLNGFTPDFQLISGTIK